MNFFVLTQQVTKFLLHQPARSQDVTTTVSLRMLRNVKSDTPISNSTQFHMSKNRKTTASQLPRRQRGASGDAVHQPAERLPALAQAQKRRATSKQPAQPDGFSRRAAPPKREIGCRRGNRTPDLQVMSLTSCRCSILRLSKELRALCRAPSALSTANCKRSTGHWSSARFPPRFALGSLSVFRRPRSPPAHGP
jgi:hypothetical protein